MCVIYVQRLYGTRLSTAKVSLLCATIRRGKQCAKGILDARLGRARRDQSEGVFWGPRAFSCSLGVTVQRLARSTVCGYRTRPSVTVACVDARLCLLDGGGWYAIACVRFRDVLVTTAESLCRGELRERLLRLAQATVHRGKRGKRPGATCSACDGYIEAVGATAALNDVCAAY